MHWVRLCVWYGHGRDLQRLRYSTLLPSYCCLVAKLHLNLLVTLWAVACQALLTMAFSRQEYWSGLPFPSPGDLPYPGIKPTSSALAGGFFTTEPPGKPYKQLFPQLKLLEKLEIEFYKTVLSP